MNCAIGQGSMAGRCALNRGKLRIKIFTSSVLQSQKFVKSSRSSSGVSKSEEKIVVGGAETSLSSGRRRLRFGAFIAMFFPLRLGNVGATQLLMTKKTPQPIFAFGRAVISTRLRYRQTVE